MKKQTLLLLTVFLSPLLGNAKMVSKEIYEDALSKARIFENVHETFKEGISSLDMLNGVGKFSFGETIDCNYVVPEEKMGGRTQKFMCEVPGKNGKEGNIYRVKYGRENGEIYSEVLASRLLWALGIAADEMYSVQVNCHGCPDDPWTQQKGPFLELKRFDWAVIERDFRPRDAEGKSIGPKPKNLKTKGRPGLHLKDIDKIKPEYASRAQIDALKLMLAGIRHIDNKTSQQGLLCLEFSEDGHCLSSRVHIDDPGFSFGGSYNPLSSKRKANGELFASAPIWKNKEKCIANLPKFLNGTLKHPHISEAGRVFLLSRLDQLTENQMRDLIKSSRVVEGRVIDGERFTEDQWLAAFKDKKEQIRSVTCPN